MLRGYPSGICGFARGFVNNTWPCNGLRLVGFFLITRVCAASNALCVCASEISFECIYEFDLFVYAALVYVIRVLFVDTNILLKSAENICICVIEY